MSKRNDSKQQKASLPNINSGSEAFKISDLLTGTIKPAVGLCDGAFCDRRKKQVHPTTLDNNDNHPTATESVLFL